jgi:hypothetical protein
LLLHRLLLSRLPAVLHLQWPEQPQYSKPWDLPPEETAITWRITSRYGQLFLDVPFHHEPSDQVEENPRVAYID